MIERIAGWAGVLLLCLGLPSLALAAEPADAVLGKWWFPEKNGKMEVFREGDKYFGKVIAYDKPDELDKNNPDPELRERRFVGILMLHDFVYDAEEEEWTDGTIYDGDSGKTYQCTMWFEDGDLTKLNARGYIGFALLGRTEIFTRVKPEEEDQDAATAEK